MDSVAAHPAGQRGRGLSGRLRNSRRQPRLRCRRRRVRQTRASSVPAVARTCKPGRGRNRVVYGDGERVLSGLSGDDRKTIEEMFVRAPMSPKAYIELTDAIASAIAGPKVDVQLGPAGVQWCSKPLLEAVAENSAETGRRIHMHLLETIYQRAWADQHFPDGIVRYLRDIGLLSERLALAHWLHARPDDIET